MTKWLSNLIIVLLCFVGIQMVSKGIEQKFYFDEVLPPTMNKMEKKEAINSEPHLDIPFMALNETLYNERKEQEAKVLKETPVESETSETNEVQAKGKDDTILLKLNAMNVDELQTLKGIGPVIAERIIAYKKTNGPFKSIEGLSEVKGIGPKKLESIEASLRQQ